MNGERFARFVNQTSMPSLGALNSQVVWFLGSLVLTICDAILLTRHARPIPLSEVLDPLKAAAAVSVFLAHNTAAEQMRQAGLWLAGILVTGWTGKSVANFFGNKNQRETSREYLDAKGKAEALTAEHQSLAPVQVQHAEKVEVKNGGKTEPVELPPEEHEWASGDPRAGIL